MTPRIMHRTRRPCRAWNSGGKNDLHINLNKLLTFRHADGINQTRKETQYGKKQKEKDFEKVNRLISEFNLIN